MSRIIANYIVHCVRVLVELTYYRTETFSKAICCIDAANNYTLQKLVTMHAINIYILLSRIGTTVGTLGICTCSYKSSAVLPTCMVFIIGETQIFLEVPTTIHACICNSNQPSGFKMLQASQLFETMHWGPTSIYYT